MIEPLLIYGICHKQSIELVIHTGNQQYRNAIEILCSRKNILHSVWYSCWKCLNKYGNMDRWKNFLQILHRNIAGATSSSRFHYADIERMHLISLIKSIVFMDLTSMRLEFCEKTTDPAKYLVTHNNFTWKVSLPSHILSIVLSLFIWHVALHESRTR